MGTKKIMVMVQTNKNGPSESLSINIDPQAFLDAPNPSDYIFAIAWNSYLGGELISVNHNYTKEQAELDLK